MITYWTVGSSFYNMAVVTVNKVVAVMIRYSSSNNLERVFIDPLEIMLVIATRGYLSLLIGAIGSSNSFVAGCDGKRVLCRRSIYLISVVVYNPINASGHVGAGIKIDKRNI